MVPWVRDDTFLEGEAWQAQATRYQEFLDRQIARDSQLLLLELGVGEMTPGVIKMPFWALAQRLSNAFYANVNMAPTKEPLQLEDKALHIRADIKDAARNEGRDRRGCASLDPLSRPWHRLQHSLNKEPLRKNMDSGRPSLASITFSRTTKASGHIMQPT